MNRIKRVGAVFAKAVAAGVLMASAGLAQAALVLVEFAAAAVARRRPL